MGPGDYDAERADAMTRVRSTNITMGASPTRRDGFVKTSEVTVGPGAYDDNK